MFFISIIGVRPLDEPFIPGNKMDKIIIVLLPVMVWHSGVEALFKGLMSPKFSIYICLNLFIKSLQVI